MSSSHSSEQHAQNIDFEYPAPVFLVERGLHSVREGRYTEGAVYFTVAREQLNSDHVSLAAVLDAFTQGHIIYWNAQQSLLEASKRFVQADAEQQTRIATLETLLPALMEEAQAVQARLPVVAQQPPKNNPH